MLRAQSLSAAWRGRALLLPRAAASPCSVRRWCATASKRAGPGSPPLGPALRRVSFLDGAFLYRLTSVLAERRTSPLLRALLGPAEKQGGLAAWTVLDGTAGYGRDALTLAAAGAGRVVAVERHPAVAALLGESLAEASAAAVQPRSAAEARALRILAAAARRVTLVAGVPTEALLQQLLRQRLGQGVGGSLAGVDASALVTPDVVYLDPMFGEAEEGVGSGGEEEGGAAGGSEAEAPAEQPAPRLKRRGTPSGDMVALEAVAGRGPPRAALTRTLALALAAARHGVVLKRHVRAPPLPLTYADVVAAAQEAALPSPASPASPVVPPGGSVSVTTYGGKHAVRFDAYRLLPAAPAPAGK